MANIDFLDDDDIKLLDTCNCRWMYKADDPKKGTPNPECTWCHGKGQYITEFGEKMVEFLKFIGVVKPE